MGGVSCVSKQDAPLHFVVEFREEKRLKKSEKSC